nr:hypothetical protein [Candidatus Freyrarchaeum guaymaensis]
MQRIVKKNVGKQKQGFPTALKLLRDQQSHIYFSVFDKSRRNPPEQLERKIGKENLKKPKKQNKTPSQQTNPDEKGTATK